MTAVQRPMPLIDDDVVRQVSCLKETRQFFLSNRGSTWQRSRKGSAGQVLFCSPWRGFFERCPGFSALSFCAKDVYYMDKDRFENLFQLYRTLLWLLIELEVQSSMIKIRVIEIERLLVDTYTNPSDPP